jgi:hypothetical protein
MIKEKLICFRCRKEIDAKEDFYSFGTWVKGELKSTEYSHKECWDNFLKRVGDTTEAMGIVRGLKNYFVNAGVLPKEEVVIQ